MIEPHISPLYSNVNVVPMYAILREIGSKNWDHYAGVFPVVPAPIMIRPAFFESLVHKPSYPIFKKKLLKKDIHIFPNKILRMQ